MNEKINPRIFQLLSKVAVAEIQEVISLYGSITSEEAWQKFNMACDRAVSSLHEVMVNAPPEDKEELCAGLRTICCMRMDGYVNWQMELREREAIANPQGKLGKMRKRRLKMEEGIRRAEHAPLN